MAVEEHQDHGNKEKVWLGLLYSFTGLGYYHHGRKPGEGKQGVGEEAEWFTSGSTGSKTAEWATGLGWSFWNFKAHLLWTYFLQQYYTCFNEATPITISHFSNNATPCEYMRPFSFRPLQMILSVYSATLSHVFMSLLALFLLDVYISSYSSIWSALFLQSPWIASKFRYNLTKKYFYTNRYWMHLNLQASYLISWMKLLFWTLWYEKVHTRSYSAGPSNQGRIFMSHYIKPKRK